MNARHIGRLGACLALCASMAQAQELVLLGGGLQSADIDATSPAWALEYKQGLGEHFAASFSWQNEGHLPSHHRDGQSAQLWVRTNVLDRRVSLAAGIGPYRYFDTAVSAAGGGYANIHGWGTLSSVSATWYTDRRWLTQLRANRIIAAGSIDTTSLMFGIGYQLEPMDEPGPLPSAPRQSGRSSGREVTLYGGSTIVNSFSSEHDTAGAIEYRQGLARYVDVSIAWLNEGDERLVRRDGIAAQLWAVREVLESDRLVLGAGFGPYAQLHRRREPGPGEDSGDFAWMASVMAAYRLGERWFARASWNRMVTHYDRDTDVLLAGLAYRF